MLLGTSSATDYASGSGYTPKYQFRGSGEADSSIAIANADGNGILVIINEGGSSIISDGEDLGKINFKGYDGNSYPDFAQIKASVDGTPGDNDCPGRLIFLTTADGASAPTERMRIDSSGNVGIGVTNPGAFNAKAEKLVLANGGDHVGITLDCDTDKEGSIYFADGGSGDNLLRGQIVYNHSGDSLRFVTNASERMRIDSSGRLLVGTSSATHGSSATAEIAGTNTDYIFSLTNDTASDTDGHRFSYLAFTGTQSGGEQSILASVNGAHDGSADDTKGILVFRTNSGSEGGTIPSERMRIDSSGNVGIGLTSASYKLDVSSATDVAARFHHTGTGDTIGMVFRHGRGLSGFSGKMVSMQRNDGTEVGSIAIGVSSTAYNTSSDYRLKENVADLDGAINRVKHLAPKRFNFIDNPGRIVDGFLAHEAQTVVPEAVTGTHNEVDGDGNAVMQGIDQSKLVPLLTAALQEAIAKIETLETKVAALEAQ